MTYSALTQIVLKGAVAVTLLLCVASPLHAQEIPAWAEPMQGEQAVPAREAMPDTEELQGPPDFPGAPLDPAGLALLAVAGGALAARRLRAPSLECSGG